MLNYEKGYKKSIGVLNLSATNGLPRPIFVLLKVIKNQMKNVKTTMLLELGLTLWCLSSNKGKLLMASTVLITIGIIFTEDNQYTPKF